MTAIYNYTKLNKYSLKYLLFFLPFIFVLNEKINATTIIEIEEDEYKNQYPLKFHEIKEGEGEKLKILAPKEGKQEEGKTLQPVSEEENIALTLPLESTTKAITHVDVDNKKDEKRTGYLGLSIDGGGIRGLMPAIWVENLEQEIQDTLGDNKLCIANVFDCIGGTSVGGIIALGLAKPIQASELVKIFDSKNNEVFPNDNSEWRKVKFLSGWLSTIKGLVAKRYDHRPLEKLLREYFSESTLLGDAKTDVFITACGTDGHPISFRNTGPYSKIPMWEVARATSAAPTYFEACRITLSEGEKYLVDGGVWANNPSPFIGAHLMKKFKAPTSQVHLLSLGTGEAIADKWIPNNSGSLTAAGPIIDALMSSHSKGNHLAMEELFGSTYYRINPSLKSHIDLANTSPKAIDLLKHTARLESCLVEVKKFIKDNEIVMREKLGK